MSDSTNTNTLVLLIIAVGLYYMKNASNSTEKKTGANAEEENQNTIPYILALIIVFSLKKEIEETITKDRIYTLAAIVTASYLHTIDADIVKICASTFATLIMLPAIQEYDQK